MQPAKIKPAAEACNATAAASGSGTSSPGGRQSSALWQDGSPYYLSGVRAGGSQPGVIACRDGQDAAHKARTLQCASPASANSLPASARHERAFEGQLHSTSQTSRYLDPASTAAAGQHALYFCPSVNIDQPAPSRTGLQSAGLPEVGLQSASQVLGAALASENAQQISASIHAAVRALSVGAGAPAELPLVTKVGPQV